MIAWISRAGASPQKRMLRNPSSSIWAALACGSTLRGAIVAHPAVRKIEVPIRARRYAGRSRRKADEARLFSWPHLNPSGCRKDLFKAATEAAFPGYLGIPRPGQFRAPGARTSVMEQRRMNVRFGALSRRLAQQGKHPETVSWPVPTRIRFSNNSRLKDTLPRQR
ncbi:MAG: hypothetical protein ACXU9D_16040 [Xanthobacteraceae bacterium]